jgi:hypothetical protein
MGFYGLARRSARRVCARRNNRRYGIASAIQIAELRNCGMNKNAQKLGRLAAGKPKNFSDAELKRRTKLLIQARKRRWIKLSTPQRLQKRNAFTD